MPTDYCVDPSVESEKSSKKPPKLWLRRHRRKRGFGGPQEHRRTLTMLFSTRDIDILKLLRWCKLIRCNDLIRMFSEDDISNLLTLSLIKIHRKSGSFVLTANGHQLLDDAVSNLPPSTPPAYRATDTVRRLRLSEIMLTAYSRSRS